MKILPNCMNNTNLLPNGNKISFGSTDRFYKVGKKEIGNNSWVFREDIDWRDLAEFEISHFRNKDKVNIIQFASSDGSEGYTQIISLLENKKKANVDKFFKIMAYDIDNFIVQKALSGDLSISEKDISRFQSNSINYKKYFLRKREANGLTPEGRALQSNPNAILGSYESFKVDDVLKDKICFQQGNMFEILPKIKDDSNTIVLCRNILAYCEENIVKSFIDTANQVLKPGSLFIIGKHDTDFTKIEQILPKSSFLKIMRNVYLRV